MPRPSEIVYRLFEAQEPDDQYSPEILITGIAPAHLKAAFDVFRTRSASLGSTDYIWHKAQARGLPLAECPDPIALVVSGEGEEFHVLFHGLASGDAQLPLVGAFVWCAEEAGGLRLHYYVSERYNCDDEWTDAAIDGLFDLLANVQRLAPEATIAYDLNLPADQRSAFDAALRLV